MAAVAFDPLEYTHELEASGVPREQAEVHARAMTARFIHNFDALVTTDYLDSRLTEFESRVDKRFTESEVRVDKRFTQFEFRMDKRFSEVDVRFNALEARLDSKIDKLSGDMEVRFERMEGKFSRIYLMFGLTMVTATIPILQNFFSN
jgi:replicative DNA helicase